MSSNVKAALIGLAVIAVAIVALLFVIRGRNPNAINAHLRATADQLAPRLPQPGGNWAAAPSFVQRYERFKSRQQIVLQQSRHLIPPKQFVQLELVPPTGTAATAAILTSRPGLPMIVDPGALLLTATTGQARYVTAQQAGTTYQVYLTPVKLPGVLSQRHVTEVIEVAGSSGS